MNPGTGPNQSALTTATTIGPIVIAGAGGFGREVLDVIEAINEAGGDLDFVGFLDDGMVDTDALGRRGATVIGVVQGAFPGGARYVIGIGDPVVRRRLDESLQANRHEPAVLVHPSATLGSDVRLGAGSIITAGVRVTTNITLGEHVNLHVNCTVGHDSTLADFVSVFPGATVSGSVRLGSGATIGTGANVLPGMKIGDGAFVGAGAVVTREVEPGQTVVGSPAKPLRRDVERRA